MNDALKGKTYLVGSNITIADIVMFFVCKPVFSMCIDASERKKHANVLKWFEGIHKLPAIAKYSGKVPKYCETAWEIKKTEAP